MRRSTRRSSMAVSINNSLDSDTFTRVSTRRTSSIVPQLDETRISVGNFSTKFSMSSFVRIVEELNDEQRAAIERVGFGNLLRIPHHTLRKHLLAELMERWDCDKRAFLLLDRELTISPIDAALILGIRATGKPVTFNEEEPFSGLEEEYGAASNSRKISISVIERRLQSLGDSANEDFVRTFLLFTFGTLLFNNSNGKIDSRYLYLLQDLNKVSDYAWGVAVVEDLFNWLHRRKEEQAKSMEGCLVLLQIWSYEHIDIGRPNLLTQSLDFPRACRWESSRFNSPRHWFTTKFDELEENQIVWKLQPIAAELNNDIIRELLVAENQGNEVPAMQHLSTTITATGRTATQFTGLPPKSFRKLSAMYEKKEGGMGVEEHDMRPDSPENSGLSTDISGVTVEHPECSLSYSTLEVQEDLSEISYNPKEDYRVLKTENSKLNKDNINLRREADMLRNQLSRLSLSSKSEAAENLRLKKENMEFRIEIDTLRNQISQLSQTSNSEEVIANLRKEIADLKEENQRVRLLDDVLDGAEKLVTEYFDIDALPVKQSVTP